MILGRKKVEGLLYAVDFDNGRDVGEERFGFLFPFERNHKFRGKSVPEKPVVERLDRSLFPFGQGLFENGDRAGFAGADFKQFLKFLRIRRPGGEDSHFAHGLPSIKGQTNCQAEVNESPITPEIVKLAAQMLIV